MSVSPILPSQLISRVGFLLHDPEFDLDKFKQEGVTLRLRQETERLDQDGTRQGVLLLTSPEKMEKTESNPPATPRSRAGRRPRVAGSGSSSRPSGAAASTCRTPCWRTSGPGADTSSGRCRRIDNI